MEKALKMNLSKSRAQIGLRHDRKIPPTNLMPVAEEFDDSPQLRAPCGISSLLRSSCKSDGVTGRPRHNRTRSGSTEENRSSLTATQKMEVACKK